MADGGGRGQRVPGTTAGAVCGAGAVDRGTRREGAGGDFGCTQPGPWSGAQYWRVWRVVRRWSERVFADDQDAGEGEVRIQIGRILFWLRGEVCRGHSGERGRWRGTGCAV